MISTRHEVLNLSVIHIQHIMQALAASIPQSQLQCSGTSATAWDSA